MIARRAIQAFGGFTKRSHPHLGRLTPPTWGTSRPHLGHLTPPPGAPHAGSGLPHLGPHVPTWGTSRRGRPSPPGDSRVRPQGCPRGGGPWDDRVTHIIPAHYPVSSPRQKSIDLLTRRKVSTVAIKGYASGLGLVCDLKHILWAHAQATDPHPYLSSHLVAPNTAVCSHRPSQWIYCPNLLTRTTRPMSDSYGL